MEITPTPTLFDFLCCAERSRFGNQGLIKKAKPLNKMPGSSLHKRHRGGFDKSYLRVNRESNHQLVVSTPNFEQELYLLKPIDDTYQDYLEAYNQLIKDLVKRFGTQFTINANPKGVQSMYFVDFDFDKSKYNKEGRKDVLD